MPSGKNPRSEKWFPALMGGFGVLMGFAAFVLLLDEHEKADSPHVFFFGLLAAALTSFVIESVRARAEGKDASAHPVSAGRVIGLLILLGLFEIFVIGSEALAKLVVAGHGIDFLQGIFSGGITSELVNLAQLALFGGLWVLLGAITAWAAAGAISISSPVNWRQALAFSMLSMLKGLVVVAGITLVYVCAVRLGYTAYVLAVHPEKYRPGFDVLANGHVGHSTPIDIVQFMATSLASGVEAIAHTGPWGGLGAIAAVASLLAALIFLASHKWVRQLGMFGFIPLLGLGGALLLLALGPFATNGRQFSQLLQVGFACAVIWLPPLIVLSFAAPWLRTPSHDPRIWGIVSAGVALILFVVTWVGLLHPLDGQFIALGLGILVFTAIVFMRGAELREYWPLVALTMGIATFEFGLGLQQLTFLNTFKSFALLQTSKLEADQTRAAGKGYAAVQTWRDEQSVDPATADLVARTGDLWNAGDNPRTALAAQSLLDTLEARRRHVFGQELHRICDLTGSSWLNALHADIAAYCEQAYGVLADPERTEALHMAVLTAKPRPATALAPLALELMAEPASPAGSQVGPEAPDSTKEIAKKILRRSALPPGPVAGPQLLPLATRGVFNERGLGLLAFSWLGSGSEKMRQLALEARAALPAQDLDLTATQTIALLDPAAKGSASDRGWLVLSIMSRDEPPGPEIARWVHTAGERDYWSRQTRQGLSVEKVDDLWYLRIRALEALISLAAPGLPTNPRGAGEVRRLANAEFAYTQEWRHTARTLVALGFGLAEVRLRLAELARGEKLSADADAVRYLELALGASFAFWATAGLLAGSAGRNPVNGRRERDSPAR